MLFCLASDDLLFLLAVVEGTVSSFTLSFLLRVQALRSLAGSLILHCLSSPSTCYRQIVTQ